VTDSEVSRNDRDELKEVVTKADRKTTSRSSPFMGKGMGSARRRG
jgi:hypothetical protein